MTAKVGTRTFNSWDEALADAKRRLAKGEITQAEYDRIERQAASKPIDEILTRKRGKK